MTDRLTLQSQIKADLPEIGANICIGILNDLLYGNWDLNHICFDDLCFYAEEGIEVMRILSYITGERTHLLDLRMYYQDGGTRHELTKDQMRLADKGEIRHPVTNELLDSVEASKNVVIYFVASNLIKGLRQVT